MPRTVSVTCDPRKRSDYPVCINEDSASSNGTQGTESQMQLNRTAVSLSEYILTYMSKPALYFAKKLHPETFRQFSHYYCAMVTLPISCLQSDVSNVGKYHDLEDELLYKQ